MINFEKIKIAAEKQKTTPEEFPPTFKDFILNSDEESRRYEEIYNQIEKLEKLFKSANEEDQKEIKLLMASIINEYNTTVNSLGELAYDSRTFLKAGEYENKKNVRVFNGNYIRQYVSEIIGNAINESENENELEKKLKAFSRIVLDVNGLKATNDLAGDENGNKFLLKVIKGLKETEEELNGGGNIKATFSSEGGDKFAFLIERTDGEEADKVFLDEVVEKIKNKIKSIDVSKVLDFSDKKIQENVKKAGMPGAPKNFKFTASLSAGYTSFGESLEKLHEDMAFTSEPNEPADKEKYFNFFKGKLMHYFFKTSDDMCAENKKQQKKLMKESYDPNVQYRLLLMLRTADAAEQELKIKELRLKLLKAQKKIEELQKK